MNKKHPLAQIYAFEQAKRATTPREIVKLILDFDLPRECVPTQWLKNPAVWEALLQNMPMTAMIRNLATMSRVGLLAPMSAAGGTVVGRLTNTELLRKARIHPIQLLSALRVYSEGGKPGLHSLSRNTERFDVLPQITSALDQAFTDSFKFVEPTGKRTLLALDVSSSMGHGTIAGIPGLTPREGTAAMALVTARAEWSKGAVSYPLYHAVAFRSKVTPFAISPTSSIKEVTDALNRHDFGVTDCSAAIVYALDKQIAVDTFVMYTDGETNTGAHPSVALEKYRQQTGIPAKLIQVAFTPTGRSIAKQDDPNCLDIAGFDAAAPQILASFSKGEV